VTGGGVDDLDAVAGLDLELVGVGVMVDRDGGDGLAGGGPPTGHAWRLTHQLSIILRHRELSLSSALESTPCA
jgi:hypothetical protein